MFLNVFYFLHNKVMSSIYIINIKKTMMCDIPSPFANNCKVQSTRNNIIVALRKMGSQQSIYLNLQLQNINTSVTNAGLREFY